MTRLVHSAFCLLLDCIAVLEAYCGVADCNIGQFTSSKQISYMTVHLTMHLIQCHLILCGSIYEWSIVTCIVECQHGN